MYIASQKGHELNNFITEKKKKDDWIHFIDMIAEVIKYVSAFATGNCCDTFKHQPYLQHF